MSEDERKKAHAELQILSENSIITLEQGAELLGIRNRNQKEPIIFKRHLFWQMLKGRFVTLTLERLGEATGGQTHATVGNAIKSLNRDRPHAKREAYRNEVLQVLKRIKIT